MHILNITLCFLLFTTTITTTTTTTAAGYLYQLQGRKKFF